MIELRLREPIDPVRERAKEIQQIFPSLTPGHASTAAFIIEGFGKAISTEGLKKAAYGSVLPVEAKIIIEALGLPDESEAIVEARAVELRALGAKLTAESQFRGKIENDQAVIDFCVNTVREHKSPKPPKVVPKVTDAQISDKLGGIL